MLKEATALFLIFSVILVSGCTNVENKLFSTPDEKASISENYNITDVDVFLKMTGMTYHDFLGSEGLRKQYDSWKKGTMDDATKLMIEQNNGRQAASSASSSAMGGALVGSLLGGMLFGGSGD
jgi:hypothetical protein